MKLFFILLLCFGAWPGFSIATSHFPKPGIVRDSTAEEFSSKEILKYYKNGNLKRRQTVFYTLDGKEYQTIFENFRKNGLRRDTWVMNPVNIIQLTKYDQKGFMKFERNYYYSGLSLESVETRRADGKISVRYQPEPPPPPHAWLNIKQY
eukprot:TRINITY_DN55283_c0_g1_i1.p1 TRINITY_DN55283_c0_g1~~TRINITY_DN55283_c0_g1_i1.p1  ORF type:complete len:150 (-),score=13.06 TRINITY_DN55283_c0_g1_i1:77-526(-)